jgi:hemoglobin
MHTPRLISVLALGLGLLTAGCMMQESKPAPANAMASSNTLYARLGGMPAINAVVDEFTTRVATDPELNSGFKNTDVPKFKKNLAEQICEATGGPCKYTGKNMKDAHKGMKITDAQFNKTGGHLSASLDKFNVAAADKTALLNAIGGMKPDIVNQ